MMHCCHAGKVSPALVVCALSSSVAVLVALASEPTPTRAQDPGMGVPVEPATTSEPATLFRDVRLFDGEKVMAGMDVLIIGDRIASVAEQLEPTQGATIIEGGNRTLLPGLIDCHTHTFDPMMLEQALLFGVTTVLDMFTEPNMLRSMRQSEGPSQADIYSAGVLVTAPGGHGTQFGVDIPTITGPEQADKFVADRINEGSDYIKIVYDGGRSVGRNMPTIDLATLKALVHAAHARNVLAVVHIHDHQSAREVIESGADGLVHTYFDASAEEKAIAALAKEKGAFVIPTLAVIESVCGVRGGTMLTEDAALAPYMGTEIIAALRGGFPAMPSVQASNYEVARDSVAAFHAQGVPVLAGTDAPNPGTAHGASIHRELQLLTEAGLTPMAALAGATSVAADSFSLHDRGRIAPGLVADLLLVEGDPTQDILRTRSIVGAWKDGVAFDRQARREAIARAREEALHGGSGEELSLIADFEGDQINAAFGAGWQISTDTMMGGDSTAEMALVPDDAPGAEENSVLRITGEIKGDFAYPWAGAIVYPGDQPFSPRNLAAKRGITFRAKGDGKTYRVMLFASSLGRVPATVEFTAGPAWATHEVNWSQFGSINGSDVQAIIFTGGMAKGPFAFEIDDVQLLDAK